MADCLIYQLQNEVVCFTAAAVLLPLDPADGYKARVRKTFSCHKFDAVLCNTFILTLLAER